MIGADGSGSAAGVGGDGLLSIFDGNSIYYGAGGGGGSSTTTGANGGLGGGGNGAPYGGGQTGTGYGSGGGGASGNGGGSNTADGGDGSAGIVLVRYSTSSGISATGGTVINNVQDTTSAPHTIISATGLTDNTSTPQHYAVTRDSSNLWTLYQNGVSQATATDTASLGSSSSFVVDSSRDGTNSGATSTTGKLSQALSFDGSNDSVSLGGTTSNYNFIHVVGHEFTISFWSKDIFSSGSLGMIFSSADELASAYTGFGLRSQNSNGDIYYHFANGGNQNRLSGTVGGFSTDGNWHNIVVTGNHAGGTLKLWEDGTLIGTVSNSGKDFSTGDASHVPTLEGLEQTVSGLVDS